jgi:6-phosphogluconolactonase
MHSYALPFMTTRHPRRLPALVMVAVGVLLFIVSQATPALAGSLYEGVYVVHYTAATVARYLMQPDGTMLLQDTVPAGRTPLSIVLNPVAPYDYVADPTFHGIHLYEMGALGKLTKRPSSGRIIDPTIYDPARSMAIHARGERLYLPEYLTAGCLPTCAPSNSWLSVFAIDRQGYLSFVTDVDSGQIPRSVAPTPDGRNVYVATQGTNRVCIYNINATTGDVTAIPGCLATGGRYPESVKVHPNGHYAYVVNSGGGYELGNVMAFRITSSGVLSPIGPAPAGQFPLEMAFHPSGTFAAVVDEGGSSLVMYRIMPTGELSPLGSWPTGKHPFSVAFTPSGGFVLTANITDHTVSRFAFDATTGRVTPLGPVHTASGPVALAVFAP